MGKKLLPVILAAVLLAAAAAGPADCGPAPAIKEIYPVFRSEGVVDLSTSAGRVVVVTVDYLQVRDLEGDMPPNLARLASGGAVALMNVNTGGGDTPGNAHATIGSGAHVVAPGARAGGVAAVSAQSGGDAVEEYRRRTGLEPPAGAIVYPDIARLEAINSKFHYPVVPGALGESIRGAGFKTAALGNSDSPGRPARHIVSMVMDRRGIVDAGSVGREMLRPEKGFPAGMSTDYAALLEGLKKLPPDVRLVALDLGDLARLQDVRGYTAPENWLFWRDMAMRRMDSFLGSLMEALDPQRDLLLLVCPTPGGDGRDRDRLSPVIMYGGGVPGGLLTSPTTRRAGIIMNIDIAPTILSCLGIDPPDYLAGRPARVIPGDTGMGALARMYRTLALIYQARPLLQKGYVIFQLVMLAISLGFIFLRKKGKEFLRPFFLAVMSVPLAYLLMPVLPAGGTAVMTAEMAGLTMAVTLLAIFLHARRGTDPFALVCLATALALSADLAVGSPLQKASIMGFDPIVGARFYGIGNEYMGVLIGAALIGTSALLEASGKWRRMLIAAIGAFYLAVIYLIAAPQAGTNVGGAIAAATAFLVVFLLVCGVRFTWPVVFSIALAVGLLVASLAVYDAGRAPGVQSHIGRAASQVGQGGMDRVADIIVRKSEMNIKLIRYTIWSRVLLASLGILALLFYRPVGVMQGIRSRRPYLFRGLVGVVAGSIVAFIFNDSGVVAAATAMIFGAPPLIYLVLDQMEAVQQP